MRRCIRVVVGCAAGDPVGGLSGVGMGVVEQLENAPDGHRRLRLSNPANFDPVGEYEVQNADDVNAAIERARKAQQDWGALSFDARGRIFQRAARLLCDMEEEFVEVIVSETGKPRIEALATEILTACDALQFYAKRAKGILADRAIPVHLLKTKKLRISYRPLGVIGIITPWNFPFLLSLNPTGQALMVAGVTLRSSPEPLRDNTNCERLACPTERLRGESETTAVYRFTS